MLTVDKPGCSTWLGGSSGREAASTVRFRGFWGLHLPPKHYSSSFKEATALPLLVMVQGGLTPPSGS